jgi:hypothetical protein
MITVLPVQVGGQGVPSPEMTATSRPSGDQCGVLDVKPGSSSRTPAPSGFAMKVWSSWPSGVLREKTIRPFGPDIVSAIEVDGAADDEVTAGVAVATTDGAGEIVADAATTGLVVVVVADGDGTLVPQAASRRLTTVSRAMPRQGGTTRTDERAHDRSFLRARRMRGVPSPHNIANRSAGNRSLTGEVAKLGSPV